MLAGLRPSSDFNDNRATLADGDRRGSSGPRHPDRARARSSSSARRAPSTATGRPTSPSSLRRPQVGRLVSSPTSLPAALSGRSDRRCGRRRGRRAGLRQLQARDLVACTRRSATSSQPGEELRDARSRSAASGSRSSSSPRTRQARCTSATAGSAPTATLSARVLSRCGWDVEREYYVNDTGGPDPPARREPARPPPRRRRARGGLPGRVRHRARGSYDGPEDVVEAGRFASRADPREHPGDARPPRHRLRRVVLPGLDRGERPGRRDDRAVARDAASSTRRTERSGSAPPRSATAATASSSRRTATPPTSPATSPTTATSSSSGASTA